MSERSDGELILECRRPGTNAAFEELVHRYVDLVYSTAFRVLRDASDRALRLFANVLQIEGRVPATPLEES